MAEPPLLPARRNRTTPYVADWWTAAAAPFPAATPFVAPGQTSMPSPPHWFDALAALPTAKSPDAPGGSRRNFQSPERCRVRTPQNAHATPRQREIPAGKNAVLGL